jgi:hypothetical protein
MDGEPCGLRKDGEANERNAQTQRAGMTHIRFAALTVFTIRQIMSEATTHTIRELKFPRDTNVARSKPPGYHRIQKWIPRDAAEGFRAETFVSA